MLPRCLQCTGPLERSRRQGFTERVLLSPFPFLRPFRCPICGRRNLRLVRPPRRTAVWLLVLTLAAGILLVQAILYISDRARDYVDTEYQPKDLERKQYLEKSTPRKR